MNVQLKCKHRHLYKKIKWQSILQSQQQKEKKSASCHRLTPGSTTESKNYKDLYTIPEQVSHCVTITQPFCYTQLDRNYTKITPYNNLVLIFSRVCKILHLTKTLVLRRLSLVFNFFLFCFEQELCIFSNSPSKKL